MGSQVLVNVTLLCEGHIPTLPGEAWGLDVFPETLDPSGPAAHSPAALVLCPHRREEVGLHLSVGFPPSRDEAHPVSAMKAEAGSSQGVMFRALSMTKGCLGIFW